MILNFGHLTFWFDRESAIGLVDYEDEDEEMPAALGIDGKDSGRVFEKKTLSAVPLTGTIWQEVEDGTIAKRKTSLAPSLEPADVTPPKRQKPEDSHDSQPGIFDVIDSSRVGSDVASLEVRGLAESVAPASIPHDITMKVSVAENSEATSPEQHGFNAMHQASSSDHISRSKPEAIPNVDGDQDLRTTPSGPDPEPLSGNMGSVAATDAHDVATETATTKTACEVEKALGDDIVREDCANGESPTKALDVGRGSIKNGTECCSSVGDCNGSASEESSERVGPGGAIPIDGSNNSTLSQQQHTVSLGSEGNKLTNLGADIMRTVSPTSPGSYPVR